MSGTAFNIFYTAYLNALNSRELQTRSIGVIPRHDPNTGYYFDVFALEQDVDEEIMRSRLLHTQTESDQLQSMKDYANHTVFANRDDLNTLLQQANAVASKETEEQALRTAELAALEGVTGEFTYGNPVFAGRNSTAAAATGEDQNDEPQVGVGHSDLDEQEVNDDTQEAIPSFLGPGTVEVDVEHDPRLTPSNTGDNEPGNDEERGGGGGDDGGQVRFTPVRNTDDSKTRFRPEPVAPTPPPYAIFGGDTYRVVTKERMSGLGIPDQWLYRADEARKAMANVADPSVVYLKCYAASINELTEMRKQFVGRASDGTDRPPSLEEIEQVINLMKGPELPSTFGFTERLNQIHPQMAAYLYTLLNKQYGRHNPNSTEAKYAMGDTRGWLQRYDLPGTFGDWERTFGKFTGNKSYLRGEMIAIAQRILHYDGVEYKPDAKNAKKFTYSQNGVTYFTGEATEQKSDNGSLYPIKIKLDPNINRLPPEEYVKALRHTLAFIRQLSQERQYNVIAPKLSSNPDNNILMLLMANGEFMLNVRISQEDKQKVIDQFRIKYSQHPDICDKKIALWEWCCERAEMFEPEFIGGQIKFNKRANPQVLSHGGAGGNQKYTINETARDGSEITIRDAYAKRTEKAIADGLLVRGAIEQFRGGLKARL